MKEVKYEAQFTQVPFGLFRDKEMYTKLYDCLSIYMYLQTCVYRGVHGSDKFDLYNKLYMNGILGTAVAGIEIARTHGNMSPNTVKKRLNLLEKYNYLEKCKIKTKYKKNGKRITGYQNIYIIGTHINGNPNYKSGNKENISNLIVGKFGIEKVDDQYLTD